MRPPTFPVAPSRIAEYCTLPCSAAVVIVTSNARPIIQRQSPSASSRSLNRGDVDLLHCHHRLKDTFCLFAASLHRIR